MLQRPCILSAGRSPALRSMASARAGSPALLEVHVQAVLDPACPWCFIGLRRMQRALQRAPHIAASVAFVPYVFDRDTPVPALSWNDYVQLRYPERAQQLLTVKLPMTLREAASEGLTFSNYAQRPVMITEPALQVIWAGVQAGLSLQVVESLLSRHFCGGEDVSLEPVLLRCADEAGVSRAAALEALAPGSAASVWVNEEDRRARRELGVRGVPHYVISRQDGGPQQVLSGAVAPEEWLHAFAALAA
jgi:predicted DsbA family dithiol-disulfide isomerase